MSSLLFRIIRSVRQPNSIPVHYRIAHARNRATAHGVANAFSNPRIAKINPEHITTPKRIALIKSFRTNTTNNLGIAELSPLRCSGGKLNDLMGTQIHDKSQQCNGASKELIPSGAPQSLGESFFISYSTRLRHRLFPPKDQKR